ncbi:TPA: hypothetical protein ACNKJ8_002594 [Enterococcus faecalis]
MNKQELIETLEEIRANIDRDIEIGDRTVFSRGEKNAYNNAIGLAINESYWDFAEKVGNA